MADAAAEIGVEGHRGDADGEARRRRDERLRDAAGQQHGAHRAGFRRDVAERIEDADDRAEQAEHRREDADVHDVEHALVERRGDAVALGLGHDA